MHHKIIYRHWQPGDDEAILDLFLQPELIGQNLPESFGSRLLTLPILRLGIFEVV